MVAKTRILATLKSLDRLYRGASAGMHPLFYSKLAVLELCGWIEESMDDIVRKCARRRVKVQANIEYVESEIISRVHGFDYQAHFRRMLVNLVGIIGVEQLERGVDAAKLHGMQSALGRLKVDRDRHAHTHIKDATVQIDAPSVTVASFHSVYDGLRECEAQLRQCIS